MWMIWPLIFAIVLTSIISIHWKNHILMTQNDIVVHDNHFQKKNQCIMCNDSAIYHISPIHLISWHRWFHGSRCENHPGPPVFFSPGRTGLPPCDATNPSGLGGRTRCGAEKGWIDPRRGPVERRKSYESSIEYDHSFLWLWHIWSCDMICVRFLGVDHFWKWWFVSLRGIIDTIVGQIHRSFFAFIGKPKVEISWGGSTDFHTLITDW